MSFAVHAAFGPHMFICTTPSVLMNSTNLVESTRGWHRVRFYSKSLNMEIQHCNGRLRVDAKNANPVCSSAMSHREVKLDHDQKYRSDCQTHLT